METLNNRGAQALALLIAMTAFAMTSGSEAAGVDFDAVKQARGQHAISRAPLALDVSTKTRIEPRVTRRAARLASVEDGGFEAGGLLTMGAPNPFWIETGTFDFDPPNGEFFTPICTNFACGLGTPFEGTHFGLFGGLVGKVHEQTLSQSIVIASTVPELTFYLSIEECDNPGDVLEVLLDGTEAASFPCTSPTDGYEQQSVDVSLPLCGGSPCNDGQAHTLMFRGSMVSSNGGNSTFLVDRVEAVDLALCGNGALDIGEACDDGNSLDGDGCSSVCQIESGFICSAPIPAITEDNAVGDPSLEEGGELTTGVPNPFWAETGTFDLGGGVLFTPICNPPSCTGGAPVAFDGTHWAWFGGLSNVAQTQTIEQTVTIPTDATELTFEFLVGVCDSDSDSLEVTLDGNVVFDSTPCTVTGDYVTQTVDLASAPGGPYNDGGDHTLLFTGTQVNLNGAFTNYWVDLVDVKFPLDPPIPGEPSACTAACSLDAFEDGEPVVSGTPSGLPADWSTIEAGAPLAWGASNDGFCGSVNWPAGNYTGGSGVAACIDSDAFGAGPSPVDSYLCSGAIDLSGSVGTELSFDYNYQIFGAPDASDFFQVMVGTEPPSIGTVGGYTELFSRTDNAGVLVGGGTSETLSLVGFEGEPAVYVCFRYGGDFDWYAQVDNVAITADQCTGGETTIGATVTGLFTQVGACANATAGSTPTIVPLVGDPSLDCTAAGFSASAGDVVRTLVRGVAVCGNPGGLCDVGLELGGISGALATCTNRSTAQSAPVALGGSGLVSCSNVPGGFTQGDSAVINVLGIAQ